MEHFELKLDRLIREAIHLNATDLHFHQGVVIFRRHKSFLLEKKLQRYDEFYNFLKYKANIILDMHKKTQTGTLKHVIRNETYYLRLSILETHINAHAVLRILNIHPLNSLRDCGFQKHQINQIKQMFEKKHGLILFCGSTGSGKTTTMYCALNELKHKQIFTLENPIERYFSNLIQLEYKGSEFQDYLIQLLRHDPDILAIGEIRDQLELETALKASLSGHLIAATMHAGSKEDVFMKIELMTDITQDLISGIVFQKNEDQKFIFEVILI